MRGAGLNIPPRPLAGLDPATLRWESPELFQEKIDRILAELKA